MSTTSLFAVVSFGDIINFYECIKGKQMQPFEGVRTVLGGSWIIVHSDKQKLHMTNLHILFILRTLVDPSVQGSSQAIFFLHSIIWGCS